MAPNTKISHAAVPAHVPAGPKKGASVIPLESHLDAMEQLTVVTETAVSQHNEAVKIAKCFKTAYYEKCEEDSNYVLIVPDV